MQYITSENNILLAYRNIKKNKGSMTLGTDKRDISHFKNMKCEEFISLIQNKLTNYQRKSVRSVEIPKPNGKTRPLGIPCIDDRIIQQCIKQILEPICEAKFHKHSYGFRPNRSTEHAIARCMKLMNQSKLHYVVDIDIKGFFDNVNHVKLKKQLWTLGIQDKNLISIIGKILTSEIEGIGIPTKGTPQGGVISPLLANVVFNELDWWISSQWETFETKHDYGKERGRNYLDYSHKYRALRTKNLKEIWLVRYADDFKIFCRDYKTAFKIFKAVKTWLKQRLDLDISNEKSKVTNLRKNHTEYLGFKLMVKPKNRRYVCQSRMCDKAKLHSIKRFKEQIKRMQRTDNTRKEVAIYNSMVLGSHNYYRLATNVNLDFGIIDFLVTKTLDNRLKDKITNRRDKSKTYQELYGNYNGKVRTVNGVTLFPIYACRNKPPMCYPKDINNYTEEGRKTIHGKLKGSYLFLMQYLLTTHTEDKSTEYNDNRMSLIAGQDGACFITDIMLQPGNMECHHKIMKSQGGTDKYENLVWLCTEAHKLIHATNDETIQKYLSLLSLDKKGLKRVNSLRKLVGNSVI